MAGNNRQEQVQSYLEGIRDERNTAANTATRIGRALLMLLDYFSNGVSDRFLSKSDDDTANGIITFLKGILLGDGSHGIDKDGNATLGKVTSAEALSPGYAATDDDILSGKGFHYYVDSQGRAHVITDFLTARLTAYFAELEIHKVRYSGGSEFKTSAGNTIARVDPIEDANGAGFKCWFATDDGATRVENLWKAGDMALCKTFNIAAGKHYGVKNRYYWRLVTETGVEENVVVGKDADGADVTKTLGYVVLSDSTELLPVIYTDGTAHEDGSSELRPWDYPTEPNAVFYPKDTSTVQDYPARDDAIVQVGSQTDKGRMKAMEIVASSINGEPAPAVNFYSGINEYDLPRHLTLTLSTDGFKGQVKMADITIVNTAGEPVSITNYRGQWQEASTYAFGDEVSCDDTLWIWQGNEPSNAGDRPGVASGWGKVAARGDKGDPGEDAITVQILSDKGVTLRPGLEDTTLTAYVFKGGTDVTGMLEPACFSWRRVTENGAADTAWNAAHGGTGRTVTVTKAEVYRRALFECIVDTSGIEQGNKTIN